MRGTQDLFDLIKSLTPQEKRQFKLNVKTYGKGQANKSIKLFDLIDKQEQYSEDRLQALVEKHGIVDNVSSAKYRLYALILENLVVARARKTISSDIRSALQSVEALYNKRLYSQCRKLLQKARRKAEKYERFEFMTEIFFWERKYLLRESGKTGAEELADFYGGFRESIHNVKTTVAYLELLDKVQTRCARFLKLHQAEDRDALERLVNNDLLNDPARATTFVAKVSRLETLGFYQQIMGNHDAAFAYYYEAISLWEQNESYINDNLDRYKDYLNNYLTCCIILKKFAEFELALAKLKALPAASRTAEIRSFENLPFLELYYALNRGRLDEGLQIASGIEKQLPAYESDLRPNRLITLCHNCAILYFLSGEFGRALEMLHRIINRNEVTSRQDIQVASRIFRLIIHYELNDWDVLENACVATERYLSKLAGRFDYEKCVLTTMRKLLRARDADERRMHYHALKDRLERFVRDNEGAHLSGLNEILIWTESKIKALPIQVVYRDRVNSDRTD